VICSSGEQRPPGRPGSPSPHKCRARRGGRLPKKPGESGSERIQSTTLIANDKGDGGAGSGERAVRAIRDFATPACPIKTGDARVDCLEKLES